MKIIQEVLYDFNINKLSFISEADKDNILLFDIETTGFNRRTSFIYLIGYIYHENGDWKLEQHLVDRKSDEKEVVEKYLEMINKRNILLTFNGERFDIPFLNAKISHYNLVPSGSNTSYDLYQMIKGYKSFLGLENCKLKTIEQYLGVYREDQYNGGELIKVCFEYLESHDAFSQKLLLLHNKEDLLNFDIIFPLVSFSFYLSTLSTHITKIESEYHEQNICFKVYSSKTSPFDYTYNQNNISFNFVDGQDFIIVKICPTNDELLYFMTNYKEYYIVDGHTPMHRSVASFLPKKRIKKATAKDCYIKKTGTYLPFFNLIDDCHIFYNAEKNKKFLLWTELQNESQVFMYVQGLISHFFDKKKS